MWPEAFRKLSGERAMRDVTNVTATKLHWRLRLWNETDVIGNLAQERIQFRGVSKAHRHHLCILCWSETTSYRMQMSHEKASQGENPMSRSLKLCLNHFEEQQLAPSSLSRLNTSVVCGFLMLLLLLLWSTQLSLVHCVPTKKLCTRIKSEVSFCRRRRQRITLRQVRTPARSPNCKQVLDSNTFQQVVVVGSPSHMIRCDSALAVLNNFSG